MTKENREKWKDYTAIVQSVVTVLALLIGGGWGLYIYYHQRQNHPRLQITQHITHLRLSEKYYVLLVDDSLTNTGPLVLNLRKGMVGAFKVLPLDDSQKKKLEEYRTLPETDKDVAKWWQLVTTAVPLTWAENEKVIEPGETDYVHSEIVVSADAESLLVVSYVSDPLETSKDLGWTARDLYKLDASASAQKGTKRGINGRR